jgi:methyltransferase family protein
VTRPAAAIVGAPMRGGPDLFVADHWQMALGERAAIEGVLATLRPRLAIELGTAQGGSLGRIAAHSVEVHTFDLEPEPLDLPDHVHLHAGDSHMLLRQVLAEFADAGRNVDFALVDGDHTTDGVRRDLTDLLESPAVGRTVIMLHDMANPAVRGGVRAVDFARFPKVAYVDLGFVELAQPGGALADHWGGLGLVVVDPKGSLIELARARPVVRDIERAAPPLRRFVAPLRRLMVNARGAARRLQLRVRSRRIS